MTEENSTAPYKVTLKAGEGYAEPWVTVEAATPSQLSFALKGLLEDGTFLVVAETAAALKQSTHGAQTAAESLGAQVQQGGNVQPMQQPQTATYTAPPQQGGGSDRVAPLENDYVGKGGHWPPAGPRPNCQHGPRDWKSFVSKSGSLTEMWACPFDRRGAFIPPGQAKCDVEWANKR